MLGAVVMVKMVVSASVPSSGPTLVGLKLQLVPAGKPEQLAAVKLMVWVEPFTGVMVRIAEADCPAGTDAGVNVPATKVKSGEVTVTVVAVEVEAFSEPSPSNVALTLFVPLGSAVVRNVAVPVGRVIG
jgi:hypothetical protein